VALATIRAQLKKLEIRPAPVMVPAQKVGTIGRRVPIKLVSAGNIKVTITLILLQGKNSGDFTLDATNCEGIALAPGATCTVYVRFAPSAAGPRSTRVVIVDDTPTNPDHVLVKGTGKTTTRLGAWAKALAISEKTGHVTSADEDVRGPSSGSSLVH
jgi:hypothetical protein